MNPLCSPRPNGGTFRKQRVVGIKGADNSEWCVLHKFISSHVIYDSSKAGRKIRNVASVLRLSEVVQAAAVRMYTLAVEHKFTKGRKNMNVIAVCLYVACRQKETRNYMLIDFSDLLQVRNSYLLLHGILMANL